MRFPFLAAFACAWLILPVRRACAAGGADVVDDAFVETAGSCHVESWLVAGVRGGDLEHLGIGCTPSEPHRLELDAAIERSRTAGSKGVLVEPGLKYTVAVRGVLSLGGYALAAIDTRTGAVGLSTVGAASLALGKFSMVNLDLGWQHTPEGTRRDALFWGAQLEQRFMPHVSASGEIFGTNGATPGVQGGVRWSPGRERMDIDLRVSHGPAHTGTALTLGVTVRR